MDEVSQEYQTISTHKGLCQVNGLAFGVASAPARFLCIMDNVLRDLEGVIVFLDDILIMGKDK